MNDFSLLLAVGYHYLPKVDVVVVSLGTSSSFPVIHLHRPPSSSSRPNHDLFQGKIGERADCFGLFSIAVRLWRVKEEEEEVKESGKVIFKLSLFAPSC